MTLCFLTLCASVGSEKVFNNVMVDVWCARSAVRINGPDANRRIKCVLMIPTLNAI